jgi:hypothetical protein
VIVEARAVAETPLAAAAAQLHRLLAEQELGRLASSASGEGDAVLMRAGVAGISKQVAVQTLEPSVRPGRVLVPMRWIATGRSGDLFPALDGNLELLERPDGGTELHLVGSYQPPLGRTGEVLDQLLLHRVARRTLESFLGRLASAMTEPTAET